MLCLQGRIALASFTAFAVLFLYQTRILLGHYWSYKYCLITAGSAVSCTFFLPYSGIVQRASFLGAVFGSSLMLTIAVQPPWNAFSTYFVFLAFFHFSEYIMTALYNAPNLKLDSFLLNHSFEYKAAAVVSWCEFVIEALVAPSLKSNFVLYLIGLFMVIGGEMLRKVAMITSKSNFNHIVQEKKQKGHELVTTGIYGWSRHPAYVGWFYWSIGTQILLANPVCTVAYAVASWRFFNDRIYEEEYYLLHFFQDNYAHYIRRVPTRLPFITGIQYEIERTDKKDS